MTDISMAIAQIKRQIDFLKQQIEEANPGEVRRLRRQLKEMQILQLWQIEQQENQNAQKGLRPISDTIEDMLAKIKTEFDARRFAQAILENTSYIDAQIDGFFQRCEEGLLIALVLYAAEEIPPEKQPLQTICDLLIENNLDKLDCIFKGLPAGSPARRFYSLVRKTGPRIISNIIASVGIRLEFVRIKNEFDKQVMSDSISKQ